MQPTVIGLAQVTLMTTNKVYHVGVRDVLVHFRPSLSLFCPRAFRCVTCFILIPMGDLVALQAS